MKIDLNQVVKSGYLCGHCGRPLLLVEGKCMACGKPA